MPAITSGRVLVTGANGFLALYVIRALLAKGYSVRFTVRSEAKAKFVREFFAADADRIEGVIVPDMAVPGAYDTAVPDVDGIVHLASPVDITNNGPPEAVITPAIRGVENLLASVQAHGGALKRWVQISSVAALGADLSPSAHYNEESWNEASLAVVAELGAKAEPIHKYNASKVLSERAFWGWIKEKGVQWDGVAVLPSLIMAPDLQYAHSGTPTVGLSFGLIPLLKKGITANELDDVMPWHTVDARDVAHAVVTALSTPEAGGERFIASSGVLAVNDVALAAATLLPNVAQGNDDPKLRAGFESRSYVMDGSKAERVLGFSYRPVHDTLVDTITSVPAEIFAAA